MATTSETQDSTPSNRSSWDGRGSLLRQIGYFAVFLLVAALLSVTVGWRWLKASLTTQDGIELQNVQRGRLMVTVTADGNLESEKNKELKCQVAGGARIISIVAEGTQVESGTELVQLDRSAFDEQLNAQQIVYERAIAVKIQAEQDYEAAKVAVREYIEGTYLRDVKTAEEQVTIAREALVTAQNTVGHTERMFRKGFVTVLQLEADKFAVEKAHLDLDAALTAKKVLNEFTKVKTLTGLESVRDAADARRRSEAASVQVEKTKLDRIRDQLKFCVIRAPQRGMVIYGNDPDQQQRGGTDSPQIDEGAMIRERQTIIRLPDLSDMQVRTTVHESRVPHIRAGMAARITVQGRTWNGHVTSIANRPLPPGRNQTPTKNYAVFVAIDGVATGLKPGMSAQVEILMADLHDVCTVPVTAVVEQRGRYFAWIKQPAGPERREVTLGVTDDKVIEIKNGLAAGERVITNPRATVAEARGFDLPKNRATEDDARFRARPRTTEPAATPEAAPMVSQRAS